MKCKGLRTHSRNSPRCGVDRRRYRYVILDRLKRQAVFDRLSFYLREDWVGLSTLVGICENLKNKIKIFKLTN